MDRRLTRPWQLPAAVFLATVLSSAGATETIPDASVVRFNAACATCHEGECSGRLSFDSGATAARNHMARHASESNQRLLQDLYTILRYTKETCRQYPLTKLPQGRTDWTARDLAPWRDPEFGTYFIPLGEVGIGTHQLEVEFDGPAEGNARLADEHMDTAAEERFSCNAAKTIALTATAGMRYYLHLNTKATLLRLRIR